MIPLEFFYINAARIFLEEGKWDEAKKECNAVLSMENPVFCKEEAHLIKFLAEYKITEIIQLCVIGESFFENEDYRWLLSKGSMGIKNELKEAIESRKQFIVHQSTKTRKKETKNKKEKNKMVQITNKLVRNLHKGYGGQAQAIYDECCERFAWDRTKRGLFGRQQILYAENATPENYSPWFLPHNSWTETKGGNWFNVIKEETIEEMWIEERYGLHYDKTKRVTFAKNKAGAYVFLGIYEPVEIAQRTLEKNLIKNGQIVKGVGEKVWIKTYRRISDEYGSVNEWKLKKNS